jgi:hypothetical protein
MDNLEEDISSEKCEKMKEYRTLKKRITNKSRKSFSTEDTEKS